MNCSGLKLNILLQKNLIILVQLTTKLLHKSTVANCTLWVNKDLTPCVKSEGTIIFIWVNASK